MPKTLWRCGERATAINLSLANRESVTNDKNAWCAWRKYTTTTVEPSVPIGGYWVINNSLTAPGRTLLYLFLRAVRVGSIADVYLILHYSWDQNSGFTINVWAWGALVMKITLAGGWKEYRVINYWNYISVDTVRFLTQVGTTATMPKYLNGKAKGSQLFSNS